MLKWKKTLASLVFFAEIVLLLQAYEIPLHELAPEIARWTIAAILGPVEYLLIYQSDWAPHLRPFVYGLSALGIYAVYTWVIEDWGESWTGVIYAWHIGWIVFRVFVPEKYLLMDFSALVAKFF